MLSKVVGHYDLSVLSMSVMDFQKKCSYRSYSQVFDVNTGHLRKHT